jgi:hypothetical protein
LQVGRFVCLFVFFLFLLLFPLPLVLFCKQFSQVTALGFCLFFPFYCGH